MVDYINHSPSNLQPFNTAQTDDFSGLGAQEYLTASGRGDFVCVVAANKIHLIGGRIGSANSDSVETATLVSGLPQDVGISGSGWVSGTALPEPRENSAFAQTKNRIYIFGGNGASSPLDTSVYADINPTTGALGTWTAGPSLATARFGARAFITKNRVYVVGGWGSVALSSVEYADIDDDGVVGSFSAGTSFPDIIYNGNFFVVDKSRVYHVGGRFGSGPNYDAAHYADFGSDGVLGTWTAMSDVTNAGQDSGILMTAGRIWLFGGNNGAYLTTSITAPITGTTIGTWAAGSVIGEGREGIFPIVTSARLYLLGGRSAYSSTERYMNWNDAFEGGVDDYLAYSYDAPPTGPGAGSLQTLTGLAHDPIIPREGAGDLQSLAGSGVAIRINIIKSVGGALSSLAGKAFGAGKAGGSFSKMTGSSTAALNKIGLAVGSFKKMVGGATAIISYVGAGLGSLKGLAGLSTAALPAAAGRGRGYITSLSGGGKGVAGEITSAAAGSFYQMEGTAKAVIPDIDYPDLRHARGLFR